uniref:Uncharacterized protein n=1 Tax=Panagrolaimus sp. ES5 TaxID=591445 RepID=A0AC34FYQ9_9BILA
MPSKKTKKKPTKPPSTSNSNDKKPSAPSAAAAAKKKELIDGKKSEIKQLQDSLSSFFTPTSSRRSRHPPIEQQLKTVPESSVERSHSPEDESARTSASPPKPGPSKSKSQEPSAKPSPPKSGSSKSISKEPKSKSKSKSKEPSAKPSSSSSPKPGPSRPPAIPEDEEVEPGTTLIRWRSDRFGPPTISVKKGKPLPKTTKSSSSPEPCSSKMTAAELDARKSSRKKKALHFRQPGSLPKGYKSGKASSSSSEDDEDGCRDGENPPARIMPDPRYYYKGFYFRECTNTSSKSATSIGAMDLIESLKSSEEVNRLNPDFIEFEVDSDSEYELEPDPDPAEFDSWNDYLAHINKKEDSESPKKYVKIIDGMTRAQRREHRRFALEFKDLLEALKDNHIAYCDKGFKKFSKPFIPPEGFRGRSSGQIFKEAQTKMDDALRKLAHKDLITDPMIKRELNSDASISSSPSSPSPSDPSSSEDSDAKSDDEFVNFQKKFSEMDLKPLVNMKGMNWRDLLPRKPPKDGEEDVSEESSITTDSDDVSFLITF